MIIGQKNQEIIDMEKQQVFYIQGGDSFSKYENYLEYLKVIDVSGLPTEEESPVRWSKNLREDLGDEFEVFTPAMPNKLNASYKEWKIWFERYLEYLHDDVILVGWSLGGAFLSKYLIENDLPFKVKALFLLAAVYGDGSLVDEESGEDAGDFLYDVNRLSDIANKVGRITIMHSKDDFVVPYEHALKYKEALPEAALLTFEDKHHFLVEELPELLTEIRKISDR